MLEIEDHPTLDVQLIWAHTETDLGCLDSPQSVLGVLAQEGSAVVSSTAEVRKQVREMLRFHGYKPAGRGKPASEYLAKMATKGPLNSINIAVDICNAVSLHSGLPISVIDVDKARRPFQIKTAAAEMRYVFNPSGQEMALKGLPCLFDSLGPCANPIKDSQRTKTDEFTQNTLTVIWGVRGLPEHTLRTRDWYLELLTRSGIEVVPD